MKIKSPLNIFLGLVLILMSLHYNYALLVGIGAYSIMTGLFQIKKDNSSKFLVIATLIFAISLILTYFQLSSPSYSGNLLIACGLAILFSLLIVMDAYDAKHDNRLSKILQMSNVSQKNKNIIAIGLLIVGVIVGLLIGNYFY